MRPSPEKTRLTPVPFLQEPIVYRTGYGTAVPFTMAAFDESAPRGVPRPWREGRAASILHDGQTADPHQINGAHTPLLCRYQFMPRARPRATPAARRRQRRGLANVSLKVEIRLRISTHELCHELNKDR
ncbi:hypothetical protein EVAR_78364_1 [Eumeta japonica]|uniref:Uncharacterized protein n=1 Tax=Eumeta variegata TaxID=151549 RepID=A0A4C1T4B1_EUMVA|nr:hypothetical protein EVAR_78364_1 [Eumeta japonica]